MKKSLILCSFLCCFSATLVAQTTFVFGIKPGFGLNSAYIGINQGHFTPFIGADLLWISADGDYQKSYEDYQSADTYFKETTTINFSGKAFLLVPQLGLKYAFGNKNIKPHLSAAVFLGLPLVELNADGTRESWEFVDDALIRHEQESAIDDLNEIENTVNDALGFWGIHFGAGAEYFFDPHFSIGGEYGFRLLFDSATYENTTGDLDPTTINGYLKKWHSEHSCS